MIKLDFSNVQKLVFQNQDLQKQLPEFYDLFQQWKMGQFVPSLRPMSQKALLDFLNKIENKHILILESYLKTSIEVEKLDYALIKNHEIDIENAQEQIQELEIEGEIFIYRNANKLYLGTWH